MLTAPGRHRLVAWTGLALLGLAIALANVGLVKPPTAPPCELLKPILCAELPLDGAWFGAALAPEANPGARWAWSIWLDFPFLVSYAVVLGVGVSSLGREARARAGLARLAAAAFVVAALSDTIENTGILLALHAVGAGALPADGLALLTRTAANVKFGLLGLGGLLTAWLAWRAPLGWLPKAALVVAGGVSAVGLGGALEPRLVELGASGIALLCLAQWARSVHAASAARRRAT